MNTKRVPVLNVEIDKLTFSEALVKFKSSKFIVTPNIDHLYNLSINRQFYHAYSKADLVLCDSRIISSLSRLLFTEKLHPIPGSDYFPQLCRYYKDDKDFKVFFLGGTTQHHTDLAIKNVNSNVGADVVVDGYSPPFGFEKDQNEIEKIIYLINSSKATVLVVGLGSPKQEIFIEGYKAKFRNVRHFMGLGATIDFQSGLTSRAPLIFQKLHLEWFYRFLLEPKRLFKRYFINGFTVLYTFLKARLGIYKHPFSDN